MRIISKFRDYYDCMQKHGQDLTQTWVRSKYIIPVESSILPKMNFTNWKGISNYHRDRLLVTPVVVGFCGEVYLKILTRKEEIYSYTVLKDNSEYKKEVAAFNEKKSELKNLFNKYNTPIFIGVKDCYPDVWRKGFSSIPRGGVMIIHCSKIDSPPVNYTALNDYTNNGLYFGYRNGEITLKDLCFAKNVPPQIAFQKISQYLSGVLGDGNPDPPEMNNEDKISQHGFDKFSFRMDAPGKKRKRRKKSRKGKSNNEHQNRAR